MVLDFDSILSEISDFGAYQKFVVALLCGPACFMSACSFGFVFLGYTPEFWCADDRLNISETDAHRLCDYMDATWSNASSQPPKISCTNFTYDTSVFESTVVSEWNLICDMTIRPKVMMSVHSVFTLCGCLFNSYIQDGWGRKKAFVLCLTFYLIGSVCTVWAPNFLVYAITRSFLAFTTTSSWNVSYMWALEYVGPTKRSLVTSIMCALFGVGAMCVGLVAWLCDTWRQFSLATSLPFLAMYSYVFLVDESPRWLLSQGKKQQALKTVNKMARWEKKILKEDTVQKLSGHSLLDTEAYAEVPSKKPRPQDLLLTSNLRLKTLLITYCWMANLLTYLAIAYNMENLKANIFVTYILQAGIEIPSSLLIIFTERFGRILLLSVSMTLTGLILFLTVPADYYGLNVWVIVGAALTAKFGITFSFGVLCQVAGESYPTSLRGMGTGFSSFVGTLGAMLMPYVIHSASVYRMLPVIIMGTVTLSSGVSVLMLPETAGCYMPETVAEAEDSQNAGPGTLVKNLRVLRQCACLYSGYIAVAKKDTGDRDTVIDNRVCDTDDSNHVMLPSHENDGL